MKDQMVALEKSVSELRSKVESYQSPKVEDSFEEGYRSRSLVFKNLDIPFKQNFQNSQEWIQALKNEVREVLGFLRIEYIPVDVFFHGALSDESWDGLKESV